MLNDKEDDMNMWDERYSGEEYHFGTEPSGFLIANCDLLKPGMHCLALADGEGRTGVWLAEQGLHVHSVDSSSVAIDKARKLAARKNVRLELELADLSDWDFGLEKYDVVVAVFIQFAPPALREKMFEKIRNCLKLGGLLLLHGYTPRQLEYRTGGPSQLENLYTESMLKEAFSDMEIISLHEYDQEIREGSGHSGMSALIDLVAKKV